MLAPAEESDSYWKSVCEESPQTAATIERASQLFRKSVKLNDFKETDEVIDNLFLALQQRVSSKKRRMRMRLGAVAASAAACFAAAIVMNSIPGGGTRSETEYGAPAGMASLPVSKDSIREITLSDGKTSITVSNNSNIVAASTYDITVGEKTFFTGGADEEQPPTLKLTVPNGRRSSIMLGDGSRVFVNAGSTVTFPKSFTGDRREIAVDGEVYLEVAKDASRPFIVKTKGMDVKVLGTEFGITSYSGEQYESVVLVSGSVSVRLPGRESIVLNPNQMLTIQNGSYLVNAVDVMDHVSWKKGWLQLGGTRLDDLAAKLSKYYGVDIECDEEVRDLKCGGKLMLSEDIVSIADIVTRNFNIRYTILQDKITLHK